MFQVDFLNKAETHLRTYRKASLQPREPYGAATPNHYSFPCNGTNAIVLATCFAERIRRVCTPLYAFRRKLLL